MSPSRHRAEDRAVGPDRVLPGRVLRCGAAALAVVAALLVAVGLGPDAVAAAPAGAAATGAAVPAQARAGLPCVTAEGEVATSAVLVVVAFPSGTFSQCVAPGGTGLDALRAAGLAVEVQSFGSNGGGVCGITAPDGTFVGCADGPDCFLCPASSGGSRYWGYYRCYAYSPVGAGSTTPAGGTIEAWRYGGGGGWNSDVPAACDDGRAEPPPTTPTTAAPAPTPPPGGTAAPGPDGQATPRPGGDASPGNDTTPSTTPPPPTTSGPVGPTTTTTTTTVAPTTATSTPVAEEDADTADVDADGDDAVVAAGEWDPVDGEDAVGPAGGMAVRDDGGSGPPVGALAGTGAVVGGFALLAVRARRRRSSVGTDL